MSFKVVGVWFIVIGVGSNVNKEEFKMIVSSDEDMIIIDNFDILLG